MCNNNPCNCKKIDWTKPIRTSNKHYPVTVVRTQFGRRLVEWVTGPAEVDKASAFAREDGTIYATLHGGSGYVDNLIENVPEEPRNVVVLVNDGYKGSWKVHTWDAENSKSMWTEAEAAKELPIFARQGYKVHLVTMPDTKD